MGPEVVPDILTLDDDGAAFETDVTTTGGVSMDGPAGFFASQGGGWRDMIGQAVPPPAGPTIPAWTSWGGSRPFSGWLFALKRLPAREAASFVLLNPPLANLWAWLFEDARLRLPFLVGAAVLLVGVAAIVLPLPRGARAAFTERHMKRAGLVVTLALSLAPWLAAAQEYDLVLRNGRIVDGSGAPWFAGDLAIRGDAIVALGPRLDGTARRVIDVQGRVIAPGFIDIHTHARRGIFEIPGADNYARQGVTTLFEGPDGSSPLPIAE